MMTERQRAVLEAMVKPLERTGATGNHMPTRGGAPPWVCGSDFIVSWNTIRSLAKLGYIETPTGRGQCREDGCYFITPAGRAALDDYHSRTIVEPAARLITEIERRGDRP